MTEAENKVRLAMGLLATAALLLEQAMLEGGLNQTAATSVDKAVSQVRDARLDLVVAEGSRIRAAQFATR